MDEEVYKGFEQILSDEVEKLKTPHKEMRVTINKEDGQDGATHKGTLIIDATIADQDIRYPTDIHLLNQGCQKSRIWCKAWCWHTLKGGAVIAYLLKIIADFLAYISNRKNVGDNCQLQFFYKASF